MSTENWSFGIALKEGRKEGRKKEAGARIVS
jgi:hypothetical protein